MGTINRKIAHDIIHTNKYDSDNCTKIVTYNNMFDGGLTFAVVFKKDYQQKYEQSGACSNVQIVWTKGQGLTSYGQRILGEQQ